MISATVMQNIYKNILLNHLHVLTKIEMCKGQVEYILYLLTYWWRWFLLYIYKMQASNDSGRGSSLVEGSKGGKKKYESYQFNFPTTCCGRLIGKYGKNINWIKDRTGANISLTNHPFTPEYQLCIVEGDIIILISVLNCVLRSS